MSKEKEKNLDKCKWKAGGEKEHVERKERKKDEVETIFV